MRRPLRGLLPDGFVRLKKFITTSIVDRGRRSIRRVSLFVNAVRVAPFNPFPRAKEKSLAALSDISLQLT